MKKSIFLVPALMGVALLAGCNNKTSEKNDERSIYIDAYGKVNSAINESISNLNNTTTVLSNSLNISDDDYSKIIDDTNLNGVRCFIYFIELLYKNENFPLDKEVVEMDSDYILDGKVLQDNKEYFSSKLDKKNNTIIGNLYGVSNDGESEDSTNLSYLNINISYDFETSTLNSFTLFVADVNNDEISTVWLMEKYEEGSMYEANIYSNELLYEEVKIEYNDNSFKPFFNKTKTAEYVGDYSSEYTKSIVDIIGKENFM